MKIVNILLVLFLLPVSLFAQIGERIVFPSPQAAQMGKFGGYNVNHSTGTANVSIPIYTANEGAINIPISLAYNYKGFRPSDEPGFCGLGWSLMAGGAISRVMKSTADEIVAGQATKVKTFVDGASPSLTNYQALNLTGSGNNYTESEPDIFSFQFDGFSGKFVLDENGNARVISNQIMKITSTKSVYGPENKQVITKWVVVAENGSKYTFDAFEVSFQDENAIYIFPTSWYLTEIVDIRGDKVSFEYSAKDNSKRRVQAGITDQWANANVISTITKNYSLEIYLLKIKGSNWEIMLNSSEYSAGFVESAASVARKLDNIQVKNTISNTLTRQFNFVYKDVSTTKLMLESMGEPGLIPYTFHYFNTIPRDVHGNTRQVDAWGFFNGWANPSLIPTGVPGVNLNPHTNLTKNGALTSISYPTGGNTSFEYEQNEYSYVRTSLTNKSKTIIVDYDYYFRNIVGAPLTDNPAPTISLSTTTRVDIRFSAGGTSPTNCTNLNGGGFQTYNLPAGNYSGNDLLKMSAFIPCNLIFGNCTEPGDPCGFFPPVGYDVNLAVKVYTTSDVGKPYYGGIRVSKVTNTPVVGNGPAVVTSYSYDNQSNPALSSGVIIQEPIYDITIAPTTLGLPLADQRIIRSNPFNPMSMVPLYYKEVKESNNLLQTVYTYTSHADQDDISGKWATVYEYDQAVGGFFSQNSYKEFGDFQFYDFMRGLPKKTVIRDMGGNLKQQKDYLYSGYNTETFKVASYYHEYLTSFKYFFNGSEVNRAMYYGKGYYVVGGWPRKTSETVTNYDSNGQNPVVTTTLFEYSNPDHLQVTKQTIHQSNGSLLETYYKYPLDFKNTAAKAEFVQTMIDRNMVAYPLQVKTYSNSKIIDAATTTYKPVNGNGNRNPLILPYKQFRFNGRDGSISSFADYTGTTDETASSSYRETLCYTHYDTQGNPLTMVSNGAEYTSYLWSYRGQYPVAEIQNADNATLANALGVSFTEMANFTDTETIKNKLISVRSSLSNALVTSYLYKPLAGVEMITDPAGKSLYYEYDTNIRLKNIRNENSTGGIRTSYCYNYAGQLTPCANLSPTGSIAATGLTLMGTSGPLPVTLVDFQAVKIEKQASLTWSTTSETNSASFEIERSADGKSWLKLGVTPAQGESAGLQNYAFTDNKPIIGENLYRLKLMDQDGSFAYSRIRSVTFGAAAAAGNDETSLFPNPVTVGEQLNLSGENVDKIANIQFFDNSGKVALQAAPAKQINTRGLVSGLYIVQITYSDGSISTHRIVKQ